MRGSSSPWEGRVEVRWEGEWHKVCDHGWDIFDASVVCRQLGYGSAYESIAQSRRYFGQGFTRVLLTNVRCRGKERKLLNCTHDPLYSHNCRHWENAGVRCHHPPVNRAPVRWRYIHLEDYIRNMICSLDSSRRRPEGRRRGSR